MRTASARVTRTGRATTARCGPGAYTLSLSLSRAATFSRPLTPLPPPPPTTSSPPPPLCLPLPPFTCSPYSEAWVDVATGDQDAHNYAECSNKGACDRKEGTCKCYAGYEGKACQRTACPSGCSGHGVCQYIEELAGTKTYTAEWDRTKSQGCKCDPYWEGSDCSSRMCPKGDDPLTDGVNEVQLLSVTGSKKTTGNFAIKYTDNFGFEWTTRPVNFCGGIACGNVAVPDATDTTNLLITLAGSDLSAVDDYYNGMQIFIQGDCGKTTSHDIADYVAATKVITTTAAFKSVGCGLGNTYTIIDAGAIPAGTPTTTSAILDGSATADIHIGAMLAVDSGTCDNVVHMITGYAADKTATFAAGTACAAADTYSIIRGASTQAIEKALMDLPNEVIRDVEVSLDSASMAAHVLTANYKVTFKNPANNNGNLLAVTTAGCNKAGCLPKMHGLSDTSGAGIAKLDGTAGASTAMSAVDTATGTALITNSANTGAITVTVIGYDVCAHRSTSGFVSQEADAGKFATYTVEIATAGTPDTFTVTRNGVTSTAANADTTAVASSLACGFTFTFSATTGSTVGDKWEFSVGAGASVAVASSVTGTKEAATCSNRGLCDTETGICACFPGHTDEDCSIQSTLA